MRPGAGPPEPEPPQDSLMMLLDPNLAAGTPAKPLDDALAFMMSDYTNLGEIPMGAVEPRIDAVGASQAVTGSSLSSDSNAGGSVGGRSETEQALGRTPDEMLAALQALQESEAPTVRPKRRKVGVACYHCRRSHTSCDAHRPCTRCAAKGVACFDAPYKPSAQSRDGSAPVLPFLGLFDGGALGGPSSSSSSSGAAYSDPMASSATASGEPTEQPWSGSVSFRHALAENQRVAQLYQSRHGAARGSIPAPTATRDNAVNNSDVFARVAPSQPIAVFPTRAMGNEFAALDCPVPYAAVADRAVGEDPDKQTAAAEQDAETLAERFQNATALSVSQTGGCSGHRWGGYATEISSNSALLATYQSLLAPALEPFKHAMPERGDTSCELGATGNDEPCAKCTARDARLANSYYLLAAGGGGQTGKTVSEQFRALLLAKYQAGLLRPYAYDADGKDLIRLVAARMAPEPRLQLLKVAQTMCTQIRDMHKTLTQFDLVVQEEFFVRLNLECYRMWNLLGTPSCIWRRNGVLESCSATFCDLVGISKQWVKGKWAVHCDEPPVPSRAPDVWALADPPELENCLDPNAADAIARAAASSPRKLVYPDGPPRCIFELLSDECVVSFMERFAQAVGSPSQKAVIMMVDLIVTGAAAYPRLMGLDGNEPCGSRASTPDIDRASLGKPHVLRASACFTLRRDKHGIPVAIVGNFLPV